MSEDIRYREFVASKINFQRRFGFPVAGHEINPLLKPHQRDIVRWGCGLGRGAIFASFGLGKTFMQLEILRLIGEREGGRHLIVCPLGVRAEFRRDAARLGIATTFIRRSDEVRGDGIYLTNYESIRDGRLSPELFTAVSLDEASVLRSYGSKTFQSFLTLFDQTRFRFVATATPSPNRYKELIHYAGFLGVMDTGQALTRFFQRDSEKANNLTLYPHMQREFWLWLHSWAIFLQKPSDLGYSDDGYALPPIAVHWHELPAHSLLGNWERDGQGQLIRDAAVSLRDAAAAKRDSLDARIARMLDILSADPDAHYLLWHDLEAERHAIKRAWPQAVEVFGSLDLDERERRVIDFSEGRVQYLASKPELSGSGCNFQYHCHKAIFLGVGYKFNDLVQAIHRIHRFLQQHPVEIHLIYTEDEREIRRTLEAKWARHNALADRMTEIIRSYGLSTVEIERDMARSIGVERRFVEGSAWQAARADCVAETRLIEADHIDLIVTSIPFGNHYEYCENYEDFGHNEDNHRFFAQMDHLTPELLRILKPGRVAAIHVKDRINFGNVTGYGMPSVEPFHANCIRHYIRHGFVYFGMITVITDVVRENNQTYRLGWTENCKDGSKMGVGSPEYVLLFRKLPTDRSKGFADNPVAKSKRDYSRARWQIDAHAFWRSSGDRLLRAEEFAGLGPADLARLFPDATLRQVYDYEAHVAVGERLQEEGRLPASFMAIALGSWHPDVWHDVNRMRTLNGEQSARGRELHICPLQFDIVDRLIGRFSNPGELVFDPFMGIGTVPYCALKMGRKGRGAELHEGYWRDAVRYLMSAEAETSIPTLFDLMDRGA